MSQKVGRKQQNTYQGSFSKQQQLDNIFYKIITYNMRDSTKVSPQILHHDFHSRFWTVVDIVLLESQSFVARFHSIKKVFFYAES